MDIRTADEFTKKYPLGPLIIEGKTKRIYQVANSDIAVALVSKDDITAGDGAKHDVIPNKARLANRTTCNVFRLLQACGLPVAFREQDSATSFVAPKCTMLPYEVVVRREAHGSFLKCYPHVGKGQLFPKLLVQFFLKTNSKKWKGKDLACDDPLMIHARGSCEVHLYDPKKPLAGQEPFLTLPDSEVFGYAEEWKIYPEMKRIARQTFLILEKAWQLQNRRLVDFKVEFGFDFDNKLLLADVIDNDSWRVVEDGAYIDKQAYRDGGKLDDVASKYAHVAALTDAFVLPRQRVIIWRGSEKDNVDAFAGVPGDVCMTVTCSAHKEPVKAVRRLQELVQEVPDSVVIAYVGRSNGAGPMLSAQTTVPVITIPANWKEFPEDVWSSLRMPSNVPVMTVLEPSNAVLAALNILSARNPAIYARLRSDIEERMENVLRV